MFHVCLCNELINGVLMIELQSVSIFIYMFEKIKYQTVAQFVALHELIIATALCAHTSPAVHPLTSRASLMKKMGVLLPVRSQLPSSV